MQDFPTPIFKLVSTGISNDNALEEEGVVIEHIDYFFNASEFTAN